MDATPSIAPAAQLQAETPAPPPAASPWEVKPAAEPAPAPVRIAADKAARPMAPTIVAEPLPWGMIALTLATAVLLILGTRAADRPEARVMAFAAQPN